MSGSEEPTSYGSVATQAASTTPACATGGCPSCNKQGLPLLLTRVGLASKAHGASIGNVKLFADAVAAPPLSYLGYTLRVLREGYLYAYYETAPTPEIASQAGWHLCLVDEGGYLTPSPINQLRIVCTDDVPQFSCQRRDGYAAAMLYAVPNPDKVEKVWLAFSDGPWSEETLKRYAGDAGKRAARMTAVDLRRGNNQGTAPLTESAMAELVYDYSASPSADVLKGNPFPRRPARYHADGKVPPARRNDTPPQVIVHPEDPVDVLIEARKIAVTRCGSKADPKGLIVALADAIAATHEGAVLRSTHFDKVRAYCLDQADGDAAEADWMFKSALNIQALLLAVKQYGPQKIKEYEDAGYYAYQNFKASDTGYQSLREDGKIPADARFVPGQLATANAQDHQHGTIVVPDASEITGEIEAASAGLRKKLKQGGAKHGWQEYVAQIHSNMQVDQRGLLAMEGDYLAWMNSAALKLVMENDFDEGCAWQGVFYMKAVALVCHGGHMTGTMEAPASSSDGDGDGAPSSASLDTHGLGIAWYAKYLTDDPSDRGNILLRALLGNQRTLFDEWLENKKTKFSMIGSVFKALEDEASRGSSSRLIRVGNRSLPILKVLASGYVEALLPVIGGATVLLYHGGRLSLNALNATMGLTVAVSAAAGRAANVSLIRFEVPLSGAAKLWENMMHRTRDALIHYRKHGSYTATAGSATTGSVSIGSLLQVANKTGAGQKLVDVYMWVDNKALQSQAWAEAQALRSEKVGPGYSARVRTYDYQILSTSIQGWTGQMAGRISSSRLTTFSRDVARIAFNSGTLLSSAGGVLAILSIVKNMEQFRNGTAQERAEASAGMLTGALALGGALLGVGAVVANNAGLISRRNALKLVAGKAIAAASFVDASIAFSKAISHKRRDDWYGASALLAQSVTLVGAGFATILVASGSSMTVLGLSMTGWGLILVLIGVGLTFLYYSIKDTPLQEWVARSRWGRADDAFKSLEAEQVKLDMIRAGVQIEFAHRWGSLSNLPGGGSVITLMPLGYLWQTVKDWLDGSSEWRGGNRDIWFRVRAPADLMERMSIYIAVLAKDEDRKAVVIGEYSTAGARGAFSRIYPNAVVRSSEVVTEGKTAVQNGVFEADQVSFAKREQFDAPWLLVCINDRSNEHDFEGDAVEFEVTVND